MDTITLDWETFYSREFSLSKMTTQEYILSPQFQEIGIGIKWNNEKTRWITSDDRDVYRKAFEEYEWSKSAVCAHNTAFDGAILSWHYNIKPRLWLDTLSMARPYFGTTVGGSLAKVAQILNLGVKGTEVVQAMGKRLEDFSPYELAKYGEYCVNDTVLCRDIFKRLMSMGFPKPELQLIDETIRMYTEPMLVLDKDILVQHLRQVKTETQDALKTVITHAAKNNPKVAAMIIAERVKGDKGKSVREMLNSNPFFAALLIEAGIEPPLKTSPTTGKETFAFAKTDKAFTELQEHELPAVRALACARLKTKSTIEETRTQRFIEMADRGPMPAPLSYCGAYQTWRWSGHDKLNLQNLPRGGVLRKAMRAPEGCKIVVVDSSNIELRVNHTLAGQLDSVRSFRDGRDLYCEFASILFGFEVTKKDKHERTLGKLCIAEGELVLTDRGLVPIEKVTASHRVWDGVEWVHHDGAVLVGEKEVITYDGLTATKDHVVYLQDGSTCELQAAADKGSYIASTGAGRKAVRVGGDFIERDTEIERGSDSPLQVHRVRHGEVDTLRQSCAGEDERLPAMLSATAHTPMAEQPSSSHATTVHEPEGQGVSELRCTRGGVQVRLGTGGGAVDSGELGTAQGHGSGQGRQQRALRGGESQVGNPRSELQQQTKLSSTTGARAADRVPAREVRRHNLAESANQASTECSRDSSAVGCTVVQTKRRVWDILNAGPRHRFTVSGKLVSNCHLSLGYGCGAETFQRICRMSRVTLTLEEADRIVKLWRSTYPMIPKLWKQGDKCLEAMMMGAKIRLDEKGMVCTTTNKLLTDPHHFINFPELAKYDGEWTYQNRNQRKKTYGANIVENVCQHLARNIIADQWLKTSAWLKANAPGWRILLQVHDEVVMCGPEEHADEVLAATLRIMQTSPSWWPEIPLDAEGDIAACYGDAK